VLLIRPPGHFSSLIYPDGPWVGVPLSLQYLAVAARRVPGVEVTLLDALAQPDFEAIERAAPPVLFGLSQEAIGLQAQALGPALIGVSVAAETFYADALDTVRTLRRQCPEAVILVGGSDVSMQPERYLQEADGLDGLVVGEGEPALEHILGALGEGLDWHDAPGLMWRDAAGASHRNPTRPVEQLDDYAPGWEELDLEQYFLLNRRGFPSRQSVDYPGSDRAVYLVTSRGCPFRCSFCSIHATMGSRFRTHSAAFVVAQLTELALRYGVRHVHFEDDNLSLDRQRLHTILTGLAAADLGLTWDTPNGVRADRFDAELVALCRQTGCTYLMFGVESGSQEVLDTLVDKELQLTDVERTLALCHAEGLDTGALFVFGLPGESKQTVLQTYRYAFELFGRYGTVPFFSIYKPYPGTALYARCEERGWLVDARPYERMGKIPHMLFMPVMVETPELDIWFVVDRYQRYMLRFAFTVLLKATRAFLLHPLLVLRLNARLALRLLKAPARFMPTLRAYFWRVLLFPRAKRRLMLRPPPAPKRLPPGGDVGT